MKRLAPMMVAVALLACRLPLWAERGNEDSIAQLRAAFEHYSGARLVFDAHDLPPGSYHDVMEPLSDDGQVRAARIALREVHKLPPGYLGTVGLKGIGIFKACVSHKGDGFRPYDEQLKGYRYYGIWNGKDGIAAAYYTDGQLPLTLHHEIFHHVDATRHGNTDAANLSHDDAFRDALSGKAPYPALTLPAEDLEALKKVARGNVLEGAVSGYASKSIGEDKAETARHFMTNLADSLVQMATRPQLAGSQRLLHVLHHYEEAPPANGPGVSWFVDVALGRVTEMPAGPVTEKPTGPVTEKPAGSGLVERLQILAQQRSALLGGHAPEVRTALRQAENLAARDLSKDEAHDLVAAASTLTYELLRQRIQPQRGERVFVIWGHEDAAGVNATLRADIAQVGEDAQCLGKIAQLDPSSAEAVSRSQLRCLRLLARYHAYIASRWHLSPGTEEVFDKARGELLAALPEGQERLAKTLAGLSFKELAEGIPGTGERAPAAAPRENPYMAKVDAAIADPKVRAAIRRVQPACVRISRGGSGVNLSPDGYVLTAGHVAGKLGAVMRVTFPDGRDFTATCTAFDHELDLAVVRLEGAENLPSAPLANQAPEKGTAVVCIGQPGTSTPSGEPTGYKPFHVSTGTIRGFIDDRPDGPQTPLGRCKHDAWTYWGHSGSPLFNEAGQVVALHNSWDSTTAMRHAVSYQAIVRFLTREKVPHTLGE